MRQIKSHSFVLHLICCLLLLLVKLVTAAARNPCLCKKTDSSISVHRNSPKYFQLLLPPFLLNSICRKFLPLFNEIAVSFNPNSSNKIPPQHLRRMALSFSLHIRSAHHSFLRLSDIPFNIKLVLMSITSTLLLFSLLL